MKIEGMTSTYYLGVTPKMAGWGYHRDGRITTPKVQSIDMNFRYT